MMNLGYIVRTSDDKTRVVEADFIDEAAGHLTLFLNHEVVAIFSPGWWLEVTPSNGEGEDHG